MRKRLIGLDLREACKVKQGKLLGKKSWEQAQKVEEFLRVYHFPVLIVVLGGNIGNLGQFVNGEHQMG